MYLCTDHMPLTLTQLGKYLFPPLLKDGATRCKLLVLPAGDMGLFLLPFVGDRMALISAAASGSGANVSLVNLENTPRLGSH